MAGFASFRSHGLMFVDEGAALVDVAVMANLILSNRGAQLMLSLSAVRIMAIGALNEALVHAMAEGHRELSPLLLMARITECRLRLGQQEFTSRRMVGRMAGRAGDVVSRMQRIDDVQLLRSTGMAAKALGIDLFRAGLREKEQLGRIRGVGDVIGGGAVTCFAALLGRASALVIRSRPMTGFLPAFILAGVTIFTGLRADVA